MGNEDKVKKPFYKRWWFIVVILIIIGGVLLSGGDDTEEVEKVAEIEEVAEPIVEEVEEDRYHQFIIDTSINLASAFNELLGLLDNYEATDTWALSTSKSINEIKLVSLEILNYGTVPSKFETTYNYHKQAAEYYISAMDIISSGVDNINDDEINKFVEFMENGNALLEKATEELGKLQ